MERSYFLDMIMTLRQREEIVLYGNVMQFSEAESKTTEQFLKSEYERERTEYPHTTPGFDPAAAIWAARSVYLAAQLMLFRENKEHDLATLFPGFANSMNAEAILSADLCLRFLPPMVKELKLIDPEDQLIQVLEDLLHTWHYSGIQYALDDSKLNFEVVVQHATLRQLYINRIIEFKKTNLATNLLLSDWVLADLGLFKNDFWHELIVVKNNE